MPQRGIGQKTIAELLTVAGKRGSSPLEVVERIHEGRIPDIKPPIKRKIVEFVHVLRDLRKLALKVCQILPILPSPECSVKS